MSKKIFAIGLLLVTSPILAQNTQAVPQADVMPMQMPARGDTSDSSETTEGREWDEGQVQVPREGQVESIPGGHVEAINPAGVQAPVRDTQPDLFRFESRLFNPIPSDE